MVVLMTLWAVDLPFSIALRWWARPPRAHDESYVDSNGCSSHWCHARRSRSRSCCSQIAVMMALARRFPRSGGSPVTPIFVVLAVAAQRRPSVPRSPARSTRPRDRELRRQTIQDSANAGGRRRCRSTSQEVSDLTTQANAHGRRPRAVDARRPLGHAARRRFSTARSASSSRTSSATSGTHHL